MCTFDCLTSASRNFHSSKYGVNEQMLPSMSTATIPTLPAVAINHNECDITSTAYSFIRYNDTLHNNTSNTQCHTVLQQVKQHRSSSSRPQCTYDTYNMPGCKLRLFFLSSKFLNVSIFLYDKYTFF